MMIDRDYKRTADYRGDLIAANLPAPPISSVLTMIGLENRVKEQWAFLPGLKART